MADIQQPRQAYEQSEPHDDRRYGMHPLLKVVIGCGAAVFIVLAVLVGIAVYAGYQIQKDAGGAKAQEEATHTFERLASEYPFVPPADGIVGEDQARVFLEVTDDVWPVIEPVVQEMNELQSRSGDEDHGFRIGSILAGIRGVGKLMRARVALAEALERHGASLDQYLWTGNSLIEAHRALPHPDSTDLPMPNLDLARQHSEQLSGFTGDDVLFDKSVILMLAGITDPSQGLLEIQSKQASPE